MAAHPSVPDGYDTAHDTPYIGEPCTHEPRCAVLDVRYLRVGRYRGVDCDQPLRVGLSCGGVTVWACGNHRESKCVPCSWRYRRRLTRIAEAGARETGYMYMVTFTAPGNDEHRMPSGKVCPCTPAGGVDLGRWNASASARWNTLRTDLRRAGDLEYLRAVEIQRRGALHLHVLMWSPAPLDERAMRKKAVRVGFGHEVDIAYVKPGSRKHAYYVAKYVTKACDQRDDVPWTVDELDEETGELRPLHTVASYRTWSSSQGWGLTMKEVRRVCRQAVQASQARHRALSAVHSARAAGHDGDGHLSEVSVPGLRTGDPPPAPVI